MRLFKYIVLFLIFFTAIDAVIGKGDAIIHEEDGCSYVEGLTDFKQKGNRLNRFQKKMVSSRFIYSCYS